MKTIAVAGSQERIGTTTQALQILQCLQTLGYEVAYVEMGKQGYLDSLDNVYTDVLEDGGVKSWKGIKMYSPANIPTIKKGDYDYLVKDYGSADSELFEKISFLEQDVKIIVGGVKPNEIVKVEEVLQNMSSSSNLKYLFSFVPPEEQKEIKKMMGIYKDSTYFTIYTPDPFTYKKNESIEYLLGEC